MHSEHTATVLVLQYSDEEGPPDDDQYTQAGGEGGS